MEYITKNELRTLSELLAKLDKERHANWEIGMKAYELRAIVDRMAREATQKETENSGWKPCDCPPGSMCFKCRA